MQAQTNPETNIEGTGKTLLCAASGEGETTWESCPPSDALPSHLNYHYLYALLREE